MNQFSDVRYIKPMASFSLVDQTAKSDCIPSASDESRLSQIEQVTDDITEGSKKIVTFEQNMWLLDNSYELVNTSTGLNTGWISDVLSNQDGNIDTKLILTFSLSHATFGLSIFFDDKADSFPSKYTIRSYLNNELVAVIPIENDSYYTVIQEGLATYDRIEITFEKTSLPYRRVHVTEIIFGIIETFDENSIVDFNIVKEVPSTCDSIPIGQITLKFDNSNNRYDIINPKGAYSYLKYGMPLKVTLAIGTSPDDLEYFNCGTYYFYKAETEDNGMTAVFTCQDMLTYLERTQFTGSGGTMAMANVIAEINSKIPNLNWNNEITSDSFAAPTLGEEITMRELLRQACEATRALCYVDNDEVIQVKRIQDGEHIFDYTLDRVEEIPTITTDSRITKVIVKYDDDLSMYAEERDRDEIEQVVSYSPKLVNSPSLALLLAEYLLNDNRKFKYELVGRGNPSLELLDKIKVYDKYGNSHIAIVTEHELEYNGGLTETIKAVGGIIE